MGAATNPPFPPLPPPLYTPSLRAQGSKPEPSIFQNSFFIYKPFFSRLRYSSQEEEKRPRESRMRNCRSVKYETTAAPLLENNKRAAPAHAWLIFFSSGDDRFLPDILFTHPRPPQIFLRFLSTAFQLRRSPLLSTIAKERGPILCRI